MTRRVIRGLSGLPWLAACLVALLCVPAMSRASPAVTDGGHRCVVLNNEAWLNEDGPAAGKVAAQATEGTPRTVRLFYFLPASRPYRQAVVDSIKVTIKQLQTFYGEQMAANGYGHMTFDYESDEDGEPLVHRVDGEHDDRVYYHNTVGPVFKEVQRVHSPRGTIQFIVVDHSAEGWLSLGSRKIGGGGGINGPPRSGFVMLANEYSFGTAAHELGHAFGLSHDFRDNSYVLSYGGQDRHRLSACSAAFLTVSPYFNPEIPLVDSDWDARPTVELLSPLWYEEGSESITVRLKLEASHGLHQLFMFVPDFPSLSLQVKACRVLSGEKEAVIEYEYDGVVPRGRRTVTSLSDPPSHFIEFLIIDKRGDRRYEGWTFAQRSPYHLATLEGHTRQINEIAMSPDGTTLASGSRDSTVRLWDTKTFEETATLRGSDSKIWSLAFSPDGSMLAAGTLRGWITLWDVASRKRTGTLAGHTWWTNALTFSPDGALLISGAYEDEDKMKVWDVATGELITILKGHTQSIHQLLYSPDGSLLASASFDYSIGLWDVAARKVRYRLVRPGGRGIRSIAFSPDGRVLAATAGAEDVIALWDTATRNNIADLPMVHAPTVNYLTFSPDGEVLASGGPEGTVILRNAATGKVYERLPNPGSISSLAYWRDGSALAASTYNGRIEVWDTSKWVRRRPEQVTVVEGDGQQGAAGSALAAPFVVSVRDEHGDPFPDMPVLFAVTEGGGTVSATAVRADTSGNAATTLTLGPAAGMNTVVARAVDLAPAVFTARAFGSPDVNGDGQVDFNDFVVFAQKFGTSRGDDGYDVSCDLDSDGIVGFSDFLIFAGAFGQSG